MNCRNFERHAADWLNRRLSHKHSGEMAAHEQHCLVCARVAAAESQMCAAWHQAARTPPAADLWPPLARRLAAQNRADAPARLELGRKPAPGRRTPRWALAAAIALMTLGVCRWGALSLDRPTPGNTGPGHSAGWQPIPEASPAAEPAASQSANRPRPGPNDAVPWSVLSGVSQNTALIDDPVGVSTDTLWTYLKTDDK